MASVIETLADVCGQTLERARDADRRHAFIAALQRRLLPNPPSVPGLRIAARYLPAGAAVGMGGDWYQFLPLSDGSLVLVIGDVVGHGVEAIATMTQIQHVIAAAIHNGLALEAIFEHVRSALDTGEAAHATAQLLQVDQRRGRIAYAAAGHPYAIVRGPGGATMILDAAQHPMLGLPVSRPALARVPFPPGSVLLAYTDGLIERRSRPITAGIESLERQLTDLPTGDLEAALDQLIAAALRVEQGEETVDDDIAVVLIERIG
jgi:serine phosphatase RsbU (regulator of sigma subunit)